MKYCDIDHPYSFTGFIPLPVKGGENQSFLIIGGISSKQNGKWEFSKSIFKVGNEEFNDCGTLLDNENNETSDFFYDNQFVQSEDGIYILGKNIY